MAGASPASFSGTLVMHKGQIITTHEQWLLFSGSLHRYHPIALDVETYGQRPSQLGSLLLGIAITGYSSTLEPISAYIVIHHYDKLQKRFINYCSYTESIKNFLSAHVNFVGWNVPFDNMWLSHFFGVDINWYVDGRILWHLQSMEFPQKVELKKGGVAYVEHRGYGLKLAQKVILEWTDTNEKALEEHVAMAGGKLSNGDHYLADLDILSHYACLDTYSTLKAVERLHFFMTENKYTWFAIKTLNYARVLNAASEQGLPVDIKELEEAALFYESQRKEMEGKVREVCAEEIKAIEDTWKISKLAGYKTTRGRTQFLANYDKWRKFNPSSGQQRALLMHGMLEFPVLEKTPTGQAKTDRANLAAIKHEAAKVLVDYSEYKKIGEAARTYLKYVEEGRLHTNYDVCGTVSGRLSGFKPSVLNMPFSEEKVMHAFKCTPGFIGIHADLAAIEPCVLAHYSDDPTLLKVYKQGQGDIYLDLALDIFPEREDLKADYDPLQPIKSEVKEKYKDLRAVCKIIHLAVSYTGTHITVAKNLSKAGYLTEKGKAMQLVARYWQKFAKVKSFNSSLQRLYREKGHIRNISGRIIQVPSIYEKDLMNRLVQSSAHDILVDWVQNIIMLFNKNGVEWRYWLPDLHDSTTFMVREDQKEMAKELYIEALKLTETAHKMSVPLKMEMKECRTLAGIKSNE